MILPREDIEFDLPSLLAGGNGLSVQRRWIALAAHLDQETELSEDELLALNRVSANQWTSREQLESEINAEILQRLIDRGLVLAEGDTGSPQPGRDEEVRQIGWHELFCIAHQFSRWQGTDCIGSASEAGVHDVDDLLARLGPAPEPTVDRGDVSALIQLPAAAPTGLDALLQRRATCRNFCTERALPIGQLAQILHRVFGAQAVHSIRPGHDVLRKTSPSGGCLHPIEVHVLAQHVDGLETGIYHYRPVDHALASMRPMSLGALQALGLQGLAGQHYFANAAALLVLTCRFDRHFWKYRQQSKAYRAIMLEAGHFSQTLFLSAAEQGLGTFITAAINEIPLEQTLGVQSPKEGVIAICGLGPQSRERREFDFTASES